MLEGTMIKKIFNKIKINKVSNLNKLNRAEGEVSYIFIAIFLSMYIVLFCAVVYITSVSFELERLFREISNRLSIRMSYVKYKEGGISKLFEEEKERIKKDKEYDERYGMFLGQKFLNSVLENIQFECLKLDNVSGEKVFVTAEREEANIAIESQFLICGLYLNKDVSDKAVSEAKQNEKVEKRFMFYKYKPKLYTYFFVKLLN